MNKEMYLKEMEEKLLMLPENERKNAIKYYEEYFDDAGVDNEKAIIAELGDTSKLASEILKDYNIKVDSNKNEEVKLEKNIIEEEKRNNENQKNSRPNTANNVLLICIIVMVLIFASPVILPILLSIIIVIFCFMISGLAILIAGITLAIVGFLAMFSNVFSGFIILGTGLLLSGIGILLTILTTNIFIKLVPALINGTVNLFKRVLNLGGAN